MGSREDRSEDRFLRRDHLGERLGSRAARGAALTLGAQWTRFVLQLVSTMILARILTPDDYGLLGMVLVVTGLAERFKDLGLSAATIQREELTHRQVSALFWINVGVGVALAGALAALASVIADFYGRPELVGVTLALSLMFVAGGLTVQHQALLKRQMRYGWLSIMEIVAMAVGVAVAILAAVMGAGYWALVYYQLAIPFTLAVMSWVACRWRPGRPERGADIRSLLTFGGNLSLFGLLNYASRSADNLLIGRVHGAVELGLYTKAYQLLLLPVQQINTPIANVAIPTLSYLQDDPPRYRRFYSNAITSIGLMTIPLIVVLAVLSEEVVLIVLGDQWTDAARIFQVLAFAGIAQAISNANGWIYVSTGHTGRMAIWGLISRPIIIASFVVGLPWGAYGVAVSYTVTSLLLLVPAFAVAVRKSPLRLADIAGASWRPLLIGVTTFVTAWGAHTLFADASLWVRTTVTTLAAGVVAVSVIAIWPSLRGHVVQMYRTLVSDKSPSERFTESGR